MRFDRSRDPRYQLSWEPRAPQYLWHNIGSSPLAVHSGDAGAQDAWWRHHLGEGMVTAGFNNERGDAGDKILNSYAPDDVVVAYASGYRAIGWGVLRAPFYELVSPAYDRFAAEGHRHRLKGIQWKNVAVSIKDAIPATEIKDRFALNHPIQTKSRIGKSKRRL